MSWHCPWNSEVPLGGIEFRMNTACCDVLHLRAPQCRSPGKDFKSRASVSFATRAGNEVIEDTISVDPCGSGASGKGINGKPCTKMKTRRDN